MRKALRVFLLVVGVVQLFAVVGLFFQWPPLTNLWPLPNTTPITFVFVASIAAAAAASLLWAAGSENYGALAGIGLDYFAIFAALSVFFAATGTAHLASVVASAVLAIFGLGLFLWSYRIPIDPQPPQPRAVRWSFAVFVVALVIVGGSQLFGVPNIIPWSITPDLGVVIGLMFIGAALYFGYGLIRPSWLNSAGQLLGFLAYDVVLILPFLARFPTTPPQFALGLTVYTGVVIYSGILAIYYLFVNAPTRRRTWMRSR
jgi:hypothetical protein